jgi:ring-1,2-phenylacetyl-CoA epoxidase subunit PaaE
MPSSDPGPEKLELRIASIREETEEAKTYTFEVAASTKDESPAIHFVPGQFLTFLLKIGGTEYRRSFSIISLPGEPLQVTVKRVANGIVSRYILMHWKTGDVLESLPPSGRFVLPPGKLQRDIFFIVAGSGIAPVLPQIRQLLAKKTPGRIHLFYSNHSEAAVLFAEELQFLEQQHPQFRVRHFLSEPAIHPEQRLRLNNGILETLVKENLRFDPEQALFMICGPFTFMRMVRITLIFMHFREDQIKRENFLPGIMRSQTERAGGFLQRTITLNYRGSTYSLAVERNQTILQAALAQHIPLPYSCEGGACSTCAAHCTNGKVHLTINEVLTDADLAEGWMLTCTGHPLTDDVVISFP